MIESDYFIVKNGDTVVAKFDIVSDNRKNSIVDLANELNHTVEEITNDRPKQTISDITVDWDHRYMTNR